VEIDPSILGVFTEAYCHLVAVKQQLAALHFVKVLPDPNFDAAVTSGVNKCNLIGRVEKERDEDERRHRWAVGLNLAPPTFTPERMKKKKVVWSNKGMRRVELCKAHLQQPLRTEKKLFILSRPCSSSFEILVRPPA
jgi:hypothetical protein